MDRPVRVQLKRTKGWKMPENTVKVDRSTKWGNPYSVDNGRAEAAVRQYRRLFEAPPTRIRHMILTVAKGKPGYGEGYVADMKAALPTLRGKNLACWCHLCPKHQAGKPFGIHCSECALCHSDPLGELANAPVCEEVAHG